MTKNIEGKITKEDYKKAKKVVEKYKTQLKKDIKEEQKNCEHESYFRTGGSEESNYLLNVCRKCFYWWDEEVKVNSLKNYAELTSGKYKMTETDEKNLVRYKNRLDDIKNL